MAVENDKKPNYLLVFISLALLLIAVAIIIYAANSERPSQLVAVLYVARVLLAIGSAGLVTLINPIIHLNYKWLQASGPIVFGIIVYMINPPELIVPTLDPLELKGSVFINGSPARKMQINAIEIQEQQQTNMYGAFTFKVPQKDSKDYPPKLNLTFTGNAEDSSWRVDTTIAYCTDSLFKNGTILIRAPLPVKILEGRVYDSGSSNTLSNVIIQANGITDTTDSYGHFKMALRSKESSVELSFNKEGYVSLNEATNLPNKQISIGLYRKK